MGMNVLQFPEQTAFYAFKTSEVFPKHYDLELLLYRDQKWLKASMSLRLIFHIVPNLFSCLPYNKFL